MKAALYRNVFKFLVKQTAETVARFLKFFSWTCSIIVNRGMWVWKKL